MSQEEYQRILSRTLRVIAAVKPPTDTLEETVCSITAIALAYLTVCRHFGLSLREAKRGLEELEGFSNDAN